MDLGASMNQHPTTGPNPNDHQLEDPLTDSDYLLSLIRTAIQQALALSGTQQGTATTHGRATKPLSFCVTAIIISSRYFVTH